MKQVPASGNKAVFVYFLVISLDSISFCLIAPILAPLLAHSSVFFPAHHSVFLDYSLYGLLISFFPLAYMIGAPILGILSDRFGRKRVLLCSLILTLIAFVSYVVAFAWKSIEILIFARLLAGLSASSQGVAQAAVIDFAKNNEKPRVISTIAIGMTMGLVIGPLFASFWISTATWIPFAIVILFGIFSIFLLIIFINNDSLFSTQSIKKSSFRHFLKKPQIRQLFILFVLFEFGWSLYYQTLPLWLSLHWHLKNPQLGFINSYVGTLLALSLFLGTRLGLRFTTLPSLIELGFSFGACTLVLITTKISLLSFLLLVFPIVLAVALIYPALISQLSELCSADQQGLLMGMSDAFMALTFTITGTLSSLLSYFNSTLPFLLAAICWVTAGFGSIKYNKKVALCNSV